MVKLQKQRVSSIEARRRLFFFSPVNNFKMVQTHRVLVELTNQKKKEKKEEENCWRLE
jgi:hypothetical protein